MSQVAQRDDDGESDAIWLFDHEPRGTCHERCPSFGTCHCGCGRGTRATIHDDDRLNRRRGMPYVFSPGHHMRIFHPHAGAYVRSGVEVSRIRPLVFWLREHHGSMRAVATWLGVPESTLRGYAYKQELQRIPPDAAKKIVAAVMFHRPTSTSWQAWEFADRDRWDVRG